MGDYPGKTLDVRRVLTPSDEMLRPSSKKAPLAFDPGERTWSYTENLGYVDAGHS
jgi:hypothetical protein